MKISNQEKALVHVAKNRLGLTDDEYRDLLHAECGVESAKDIDRRQLDRLMRRFRLMGFRGKIKQETVKARQTDPGALPTPAQLHKIQGLYERLGWNCERQLGFNNRQIKRPWPQTRAEANKIAEGLKAILARAKEQSL